MISSMSRTTLKASEFIEGAPEPQFLDTKENIPPYSNSASMLSAPAKSLPPAKQPPSTPLNTTSRLPLTHLIGQAPLKTTENPTHQEELLWKQSTPGSQITPGRKRKRARSSSPPSVGNKNFKTPKPDPASEVWSRYNANINDYALRASQSGLEKLLIESSPRSSETAGSVGGLRRYNSCGYEWPMSKKKKQKIKPVHTTLSHQLEEDKDGLPSVSKVSLLLEEVQRIQELDRRRDLDQPPEISNNASPHSSPFAVPVVIVEEAVEPIESPLQNRGDSKQPAQVLHAQDTPVKQTESFCEYDEFDIDDEDLDQLIASTATVLDVPQPTENPAIITPLRSIRSSSTNEFDDGALSGNEWDQVAAGLAHQTPVVEIDNNSTGHPSSIDSSKAAQITLNRPSLGSALDEYDDLDFEDFEIAESMSNDEKNGSLITKSSIQRYLIKSIHESTYVDDYGREQPEKVLNLEAEKLSSPRAVILRQSWFETPCTIDSFVHIIGKFNSQGVCLINNDVNMLILHPDHLVSATVVADSFGCIRRAVLQDRVKATSEASAPMLYGNLLHELFQEAMARNSWDMDILQKLLINILPRHLETLAEIGLNINQVKEYLIPRLLEMAAWADKFVRKSPHEDALVDCRNGEKSRISVNKLLDIEEHVWSPNYGLKGNIDATVQIAVEDDGKCRTLTVPLEVKTGKRVSEAHQAQTALYTLLVSDRYDIDVTDGILYYLETSKTMRVKAMRHELIHMIMKRNELACYIRERLKLPPILEPNRQRLCGNCYAQKTCYLYHKLSEKGDGSALDKKDIFQALVSPLKSVHQQFFQRWDHLITKEESEMMKFRRELWTMLSTEREKLNRCFSHVIIDPKSALEQPSTGKINRFQYSFIKQNHEVGFSFTESQITMGEPIVVSDELGHFALANGYVTHIHKNRITVAVDRRLQNARLRNRGFDPVDYQSFTGIMEVNPASSVPATADMLEPILYRVDKDEFSNGMATVRNNMLQIMDKSVFKAEDLRSLIIENKAPQFKESPNEWAIPSRSWDNEMNSDQRHAIEKVLAAEDYALVLGMPGTGKTTTIAHIIRCLVAKGKTVLLTSYTHTAVDNILLKIRNADFDILRLGVRAKVHPEVQEFAILVSEPKESLEELQEAWHSPPVVATTCLGISHSLFSQRTFDYCIVDEASQITLPVCLGPIRMAKSFILVGDHYQLPPLVQNKEAREGGLDMSLFRFLSEQHPEAVVSLEHQYRMSEDIMTLANALIYSGRLKCGNEAVAKRALALPNSEQILQSHHHPISSTATSQPHICPSHLSSNCFLQPLLSPETRVLFLNTDPLDLTARDITQGNRTTNPFEAKLTTHIASTLLAAGLPAKDLGIVTFYRSQLSILRHSLRSHPALELHTADKFQGRDKEAIIVSFVRSNDTGSVGDLLRDWRRVNVAVTRARSKLVLIGSERTLRQGGNVLKGLVDMCRAKGWVVDLPVGAVDGHVWRETGNSSIGTPREAMTSSTDKRRKVLKEIDGNSPKTPSKGPKKVVKAGRDVIVGSRPVLRDILNDVL